MKILNSKYILLKKILSFSYIAIFIFTLFFSFIVTPYQINAANNTGSGNNTGPGNNTGLGNNTGKDENLNIDVKIENPLGSKINSIPEFIETLLNIVVTIGVPLVALAIIYTGFLFVTAQGNSEKLTTAKNALLYTLIGAGLVLGAWVLANSIAGTVEQIKSEVR